MTRKVLLALLLLAAPFFLAACSDKITTSDEDIKAVLDKQVRNMLEDKQNPAVLVDIRPEYRFNQGHIEGAINIPVAKLVAADSALANTNIIVYGAGYTDYLTPAAAKKLIAMGYTNVFAYRGGLVDWKNGGGKVVGTENAATQKSAPSASPTTPAPTK